MWQRIQTLFIFIALALTSSLFWLDLSKTVLTDGTIEYVRFIDKPIYTVWISLLTLLQALSLGGYKWRMKQLRVVIFTGIVSLGFQAWLVVAYFTTKDVTTFSWVALFPLVAAVMDFFAARNILLDEAIVQSAHRLRASRKKKK